jgi:hypothetical protein
MMQRRARPMPRRAHRLSWALRECRRGVPEGREEGRCLARMSVATTNQLRDLLAPLLVLAVQVGQRLLDAGDLGLGGADLAHDLDLSHTIIESPCLGKCMHSDSITDLGLPALARHPLHPGRELRQLAQLHVEVLEVHLRVGGGLLARPRGRLCCDVVAAWRGGGGGGGSSQR